MLKQLVSTFWLVLLWWTAYALMFASQVVSMGEQQAKAVTWTEALRYSFAGWMTWVPLSMALCWLVFRFPVERGNVLRAIPVLLMGVLAAVLLRAVHVYATNSVFGWYPVLPEFGVVLGASIRNNLMLGLTVVGVAHVLVYHRQVRDREQKVTELETHLAKTRLDALRAQLHPHFLFNALNSVAEMVHEDPEIADRMLVSLSALLRASLSAKPTQIRALRDELVMVEHYLLIEKIRLGDRLNIAWEIDGQCLDFRVPVMVLQPLVENAIVHAISRHRSVGHLSVRANSDGANVRLYVENTIVSLTASPPGMGLGLSGVRDRLQLLYGGRATLETHESDPERYVVEVRIPMDFEPLTQPGISRQVAWS